MNNGDRAPLLVGLVVVVAISVTGCGSTKPSAHLATTTTSPATTIADTTSVPVATTTPPATPAPTTTPLTTLPPTTIITIPENQTADARLACSTWNQQLRSQVQQAIAARNPSPLIALVTGNGDPNAPWATADSAATAAGPFAPGDSTQYQALSDAFQAFTTAVSHSGPNDDMAGITKAASAIDAACRTVLK